MDKLVDTPTKNGSAKNQDPFNVFHYFGTPNRYVPRSAPSVTRPCLFMSIPATLVCFLGRAGLRVFGFPAIEQSR